MSTVSYSLERGVATITLDSPANRNALSAALVAELQAALYLASRDAEVRAIVLTHAAPAFCSGNDLREAREEGGAHRSTERLVDLLRSIVESPKPVIARVDGAARAGGVGLIGACDLAFATPSSTFAFSEVRIGLVPAMISLTTRTRMPDRATARYFLTGEVFDGRVAEQIGLITEVSDDLDSVVDATLDSLRKGAPTALAEAKALTTGALLDAFDAEAAALQRLTARLIDADDGREGIASFLEKRPASWVIPSS
jgi:enoyl-CoA hydratase